jgi:AcrR family transcriptional regulator
VRDAAGEVAVDPDERLWRSLRAAFERVAENREVWRLLYPPEGPPPSGPLGARAALNRAAMTELVTTLLREAAAAPGSAADDAAYEHIEPLAHALVGAVLGMASWAVAHPDEPSDLHALRLMNLVWRGFEGLREGNLWMPAEWRQQ